MLAEGQSHRMAQITAVGFLLSAGAIGTLAADSPRTRMISQILAVAVLTISFGAGLGYLYDVRALFDVQGFGSVSLNTAVAFIILGVGILAAHPRGYAGFLVSDNIGGQLARRLIPVSLILPILFGWLRLVGERQQFYNSAIGTGLFCVATTAGMVSLICVTTLWVERIDVKRRRAHRQLKERELRYRSLFENCLDPIFAIGAHGKLLAVNPAAIRTSGYDEEELRAMQFLDICAKDQREAMRDAFHSALSRDLLHTETSIITKNEERRDLYITGAPVIENGETISVSCIARDVTREKQAERALKHAKGASEAADRAKSEFLTNISHEIRTPIHAIIGMLNLILEEEVNPDRRNSLQMALGPAKSLLDIFDKIFVMSRLESGMERLEEKIFPLKLTLDSMLEPLRLQATAKGLEFCISISEEVPDIVAGDSQHLNMILTSIVDNAVKFTDHGRISVGVGVIGSKNQLIRLRFEVRDTGIGFSEDVRNFEPFVQADTSTTRAKGGLGLGLAIATRLATLTRGELNIERDKEGGTAATYLASFETDNNHSLPADV